MKKVGTFFLLFAGLVILVLLGLLVRSLTIASRQISVAENTWRAPDDAVVRLSEAITYRTITHADPADMDTLAFLRFQTFLEERFPLITSRLVRERIGLSLLYTWRGSNPSLRPALLMAHQDVVPADDSLSWSAPPFSGEVKDGYIYGRGSLDIKSGILGIMEAVEALLAEGFVPEQTIYLAFGHDEESGVGTGADEIVTLLKNRSIRLDYVLDEGGLILKEALPGLKEPVALIGIAEKGYMNIRITAKADGGHSSMPGKTSAVTRLSEAIVNMQKQPFPARLEGPLRELFAFTSPEMSYPFRLLFANPEVFGGLIKSQMAASPSGNAILRTTTAVPMLQGSSKENVIPAAASAIANLRLLPGTTADDVIRYLNQVIGDTTVQLEILSYQAASPVSSSASAAFENIRHSVKAVFPNTVSGPYLLVALTDSRHFADIADNVYRFHPAVYDKADLKRLHGRDERISVENYLQSIAFYRLLLLGSGSK